MTEQLVVHGKKQFRRVDLTVPAELVEEKDILFGVLRVHTTYPITNWVHRIEALSDDQQSGLAMDINSMVRMDIKRDVPVMKGECRVCGRPAKYRDLCAADYQAQRRAARSDTEQRMQEDQLPFH